MPRAFDRRTPKNDKDPLVGLLDFENWAKSIDETADVAGQMIRDFNVGLAALSAEVGAAAQQLAQQINDWLASIGLDPVQFEDPDFDPIEFILTWVEDWLIPTNLIGDAKWSDLYASLTGEAGGDLVKVANFVLTGVYGPVTPNRLAMIPISHVGEANPNLLAGYTFEGPDTISGGEDVWVWDGDVGHSAPGSVTVNADGTSKELLSVDIAVSQGHRFTIGGWVRWAGLTGSGAPVQIAVTAYHGDGATEQAIIASHNTIPTTTDWLYLTGSYTTPADVISIRVRLVVLATATAGQIWFDDLSAVKDHNALFQRLVAGTDPGTLLPQDISNLFTGIISNTLALLEKASQGDLTGLIQTIEGDVQEGFEDVGARLADMLTPDSILDGSQIGLGAIADEYVPGLSTIHDVVVKAVGALEGSGFDIEKMIEVLAGQKHAVVDAAAGVTNLVARLSHLESKVASFPVAYGGSGSGTAQGGALGVYDIDGMERVSSTSLGVGWLTTYRGGAGVWATPDGHNATFVKSGTVPREFLSIRNNPSVPRSQTDYQRVTLELSSKGERVKGIDFSGLFDHYGENHIWLRVSDDTTTLDNITGILINYTAAGGLVIARYIAGTPTVLASVPADTIVPPGPGANLVGEAGYLTDGAVRMFRAKIGASVRLAVNEVGTASGLGPAYRRWAHGGRVDGTALWGQQACGGLHYFSGADQVL